MFLTILPCCCLLQTIIANGRAPFWGVVSLIWGMRKNGEIWKTNSSPTNLSLQILWFRKNLDSWYDACKSKFRIVLHKFWKTNIRSILCQFLAEIIGWVVMEGNSDIVGLLSIRAADHMHTRTSWCKIGQCWPHNLHCEIQMILAHFYLVHFLNSEWQLTSL